MKAADIDAARTWLRSHLADDEPIEIAAPSILDAAASVIVEGGGRP